MKLETLKVAARNSSGSANVGRLRAEGALPGVLYGGKQDPLSIQLDQREFTTMLHEHGGEHAVVQLEVEDDASQSTPALLKDVQHHPVRGHVLHVDFQRIRLDQRIVTRVRIRTIGQSIGVREGGILDHPIREVEVECLAGELPDEIVTDVSELNIGDSVHARDLVLPEGVTMLTRGDLTVAAVHAPRIVEEEVEAEGEEGEEGEGAEGEEGDEEAEKKEE